MLTIAKLTTYATFNGDIDGWARTADTDDAASLTDADWYLIDELLTNLATVASGRASAAFAADVERRLRACTADEPTRDALRALASKVLQQSGAE
jgi:hypothetical protein